MKISHIYYLLLLLLLTFPAVTYAAADVLIYPSRVVMTDRQRTAQVEIVNTSQVQATYQITLTRKRMTESGEFLDATTAEPGEKFANDVVKYSPRQVTLVPGASQTIRMMTKVPSDLVEGEYRSHLVFSKPPEAVTDLRQNDQLGPKGVSMLISTTVGISIPVIVRHGNLIAKAAIDPASVNISAIGKKRYIEFMMIRSGTRSVYGDVILYRDKEKVAEGNGFAVYTPNTRRKVSVPLPESARLKPGDLLRIVFTEKDEKQPMAETTVVIP